MNTARDFIFLKERSWIKKCTEQIITPATNSADRIYVAAGKPPSGMNILLAVGTVTNGTLLINDEAFIVCGAIKKSILIKGIKNANTEDASRKNLLPA